MTVDKNSIVELFQSNPNDEILTCPQEDYYNPLRAPEGKVVMREVLDVVREGGKIIFLTK